MPGLTVTFARGENAGGVTDSVATTDAGGVATVGSWTLGAEGEYHLTATAAGAAMTGSPSTFTATSRPPAGTPASVVIVSGDNQTGEVLTDLPQRLRVRVLDAAGRPVSGVTVSFTPGTGSGSFPPPLGLPPIRTNAAGEAESYPWTLGRAAGGQYVAASIPLGPDIAYPSFNATATPGTVRRLVKVSGDGGTYLTGTSLPAPQLPRAQVLDQYDNPVPGLAVAFALTAGGGSLAGPAAITDPMGVARPAGWVLGSVAGANTVTATATVATGSLTPGTLTFTNAGVLTTPNLLQNASFEAPVTSGLITQFGIWGGDATQSVAPVGFAAQDGLRVLRFIATAAVASTPTTASQLWQQVDVSQYRALIDAGAVGITGRALFNRIGGEASDSLFSVRIYAFSGHRVDFVNRYAAGAWLARGLADLKSDGNLLTWQEGVATMTLPVGTEYVVIELIAFEDVINDGAGTAEFLGHYADRASLVLVRQ